jgi:hypothetical protein
MLNAYSWAVVAAASGKFCILGAVELVSGGAELVATRFL